MLLHNFSKKDIYFHKNIHDYLTLCCVACLHMHHSWWTQTFLCLLQLQQESNSIQTWQTLCVCSIQKGKNLPYCCCCCSTYLARLHCHCTADRWGFQHVWCATTRGAAGTPFAGLSLGLQASQTKNPS